MGRKKTDKYTADKEKTVEQLKDEVNNRFERWNHIFQHGCADPFHSDGTNINLVRNHIIYYYKLIEEKLEQDIQLSLFDSGFDIKQAGLKSIPPRMPDDWMCPTGDYPDRLNRFNT